MVVFCIPITKEPKSLEDYCRETMKEKQEPQEVREERIRIQQIIQYKNSQMEVKEALR